MTVFQILKAEIKSQKRWNSPLFLLLFILPIFYTFLFGFTYYKNVVNHLPTVIFDEDNSYVSRQIITAYDDSDRFEVLFHAQSFEELQDIIGKGDAYIGIYIPPQFSHDIKRGIPTTVGMIINSTNMIFGNSAITASQEINMNAIIKGGQKLTEATGQPPAEALCTAYPIQVKIRILNNPTNNYTNFLLLGLIANGMQIGILLFASSMLCGEYKRVDFWSQTSTLNIVLGKFLACWLPATFSLCLCEEFAHFIFNVPLRAPIWQIIILSAAFIFIFTSLCLLFSAIFTNPVNAVQLPLGYIMPGLLYSGLTWPLGWVDPIPSFLGKLMPLYYFAIPLRALSLQGFSPDYFFCLKKMLGTGMVLLIFAGLIFQYKRKHFVCEK